MYLLDSNTVIYYLNAALPSSAMRFMDTVVDEHCNISAITKIETLGYNFKSPAEQKTMETFIAGSAVLPIDDNVINKPSPCAKQIALNYPMPSLPLPSLSMTLPYSAAMSLTLQTSLALKLLTPGRNKNKPG